MSAYTVTPSLLSGTYHDTQRLIAAAAALPTNLTNADVHVDVGSTLAGTGSFAAELVRALLVHR